MGCQRRPRAAGGRDGWVSGLWAALAVSGTVDLFTETRSVSLLTVTGAQQLSVVTSIRPATHGRGQHQTLKKSQKAEDTAVEGKADQTREGKMTLH
jgi:hypothetical protein